VEDGMNRIIMLAVMLLLAGFVTGTLPERDAAAQSAREQQSRAEAIAQIGGTDLATDAAVSNLIEHYRGSEAGYQGRALEAFRKDKDLRARGTPRATAAT